MDLLSKIVCYHNEDFYFMWKPRSMPTAFGQETCFLDMLLWKDIDQKTDFPIPAFLTPHIDLPWFTTYTLTATTIQTQFKIFGMDHELGLLNRLDNETAGFLYFAKTQEVFNRYKHIQAEGDINKQYIAQVYGAPKDKEFEITTPIMHHKYKEDRMILVRNEKDAAKWRSKQHQVRTTIKVLDINRKNLITTLLVTIYKGVRHQIRVHLAGIGYPVIGDTLYGEDKKKWILRLWSMGFQIHDKK